MLSRSPGGGGGSDPRPLRRLPAPLRGLAAPRDPGRPVLCVPDVGCDSPSAVLLVSEGELMLYGREDPYDLQGRYCRGCDRLDECDRDPRDCDEDARERADEQRFEATRQEWWR